MGKVALVTGAAGLLGRAHCHALAAAGARVVAVDVREDACRALARASRTATASTPAGGAATSRARAAVMHLAREVVAWGGGLDVLVNNAAVDDKVEAPAVEGALRFEDYPWPPGNAPCGSTSRARSCAARSWAG